MCVYIYIYIMYFEVYIYSMDDAGDSWNDQGVPRPYCFLCLSYLLSGFQSIRVALPFLGEIYTSHSAEQLLNSHSLS